VSRGASLVLGVLCAIATSSAAHAAAPTPLLVVASNNSPWLADHVVTWRPGAAVRSLGPGSLPARSPDGKRIAFIRAGELWVARADGSHADELTHGLLPFPGGLLDLRWSPDGSHIAVDPLGAVVDVATGAATRLPAEQVSWAPDSQRLVYVDRDVFPNQVVVTSLDGITRTCCSRPRTTRTPSGRHTATRSASSATSTATRRSGC
jgi:Tol biopolymer transport system component